MDGFPHAQFESLNSLYRIIEQEIGVQELLEETIKLVVAAVPEADHGAVTLLESSGMTTATQTDDFAREIDELERDAGEGPCIQAIRTGVVHRVDDYTKESRWPLFAKLVAERGIRSSLGIPLKVEDEVKGALNLYSKEVEGFLDTDLEVIELFAKKASVGLANAEIHRKNRQMISNLEEAMKSRELIGQAQGILMEREGCSAEQAFQMLVRASQNLNIKLRLVAERVVADKEPSRN
jgi:GAF domain-containing protein